MCMPKLKPLAANIQSQGQIDWPASILKVLLSSRLKASREDTKTAIHMVCRVLTLLIVSLSLFRRLISQRVNIDGNCAAISSTSERLQLTDEAKGLHDYIVQIRNSQDLSAVIGLDSKLTLAYVQPDDRVLLAQQCDQNQGWTQMDENVEICVFFWRTLKAKPPDAVTKVRGMAGMPALFSSKLGSVFIYSKTKLANECFTKAASTDSIFKKFFTARVAAKLLQDVPDGGSVEDQIYGQNRLKHKFPPIMVYIEKDRKLKPSPLLNENIKFSLVFPSPNDSKNRLHFLPIIGTLTQEKLKAMPPTVSITLKQFGIRLVLLAAAAQEPSVKLKETLNKLAVEASAAIMDVTSKTDLASVINKEVEEDRHTPPLNVGSQILFIGPDSFRTPSGVLRLTFKDAERILSSSKVQYDAERIPSSSKVQDHAERIPSSSKVQDHAERKKKVQDHAERIPSSSKVQDHAERIPSSSQVQDHTIHYPTSKITPSKESFLQTCKQYFDLETWFKGTTYWEVSLGWHFAFGRDDYPKPVGTSDISPDKRINRKDQWGLKGLEWKGSVVITAFKKTYDTLIRHERAHPFRIVYDWSIYPPCADRAKFRFHLLQSHAATGVPSSEHWSDSWGDRFQLIQAGFYRLKKEKRYRGIEQLARLFHSAGVTSILVDDKAYATKETSVKIAFEAKNIRAESWQVSHYKEYEGKEIKDKIVLITGSKATFNRWKYNPETGTGFWYIYFTLEDDPADIKYLDLK